ncbi:MAG: protein kinase [Polyangiales bacterium]
MESNKALAERLVGRVVAEKYRLLRVLGVGGHGAVFEALHQWTNRRVALKVLLGAAAAGPAATERFLREARTAAGVRHEAIVQVLDMGRDDALDGLYLVVEFLDGEDLRARLRDEGHLAPQTAVDLMLPVMRALAAAHTAGVVHRDVKPANIFLARNADGTVSPKLIDFGVSRHVARDADGAPLTLTGSPVGTPEYMSPEQARGASDLDARSDIWSVAVVLYEMLGGARPFQGTSYNALMFRVALEPPPPLGEIAPALPAALVAAVHRGLEKSPDDRYATMEDFVAALVALRDSLATTRGDVRPVRAAADAPTPVPPPASDTLASAPPAAAAPSPPLAPLASLPSALGRAVGAASLEVNDAEVDVAASRARRREWATGVAALLVFSLAAAGLAWKLQDDARRNAVPTPVSPLAAPATPPTPTPLAAPTVAEPSPERTAFDRLFGSQVRNVAEPARPAVRRCLGATFFGQVVVVFTVRPDGSVQRAEAEGPLGETTRGRCVAEALAALRFPVTRGRAPSRVTWRYVFAPGEGDASAGAR